MPDVKSLRAAFARANQRIRDAEDALLAERRRSQEVAGLYADADVARPGTLPNHLRENG